MSDPGIVVRGGDDLAKAFSKLADDIKGPALEAATRAAALPVLNQVRITEPEGGRTPYKTGTYRRGWHLETVVKTPERCTVIVGNDQATGAPAGVRVRRRGQTRPRLQSGRSPPHPAGAR